MKFIYSNDVLQNHFQLCMCQRKKKNFSEENFSLCVQFLLFFLKEIFLNANCDTKNKGKIDDDKENFSPANHRVVVEVKMSL